MSAAELKAYIDKVLGNSIRCLLPSYWWKRLFGLVVDKVAEIEGNVSDVKINKVDKINGKGLSTNDYTAAEKNKLAGIAANAEVNVQSDWNATSGDALILNKPSIPTETTVANWGFTKNTGTYSKPSSGIPQSDLASAVQTSLAKADAAVQKVKTINGESIIGDGNIDIKAGSDIDVTLLATKADLEEAEEVHAAALNALHVRILALESAIGNR